MKQIIERYNNDSIRNKYYINHLDQTNGIYISYYTNGNIWYKANYLNDKLFGLDNWYDDNNKLIERIYHL